MLDSNERAAVLALISRLVQVHCQRERDTKLRDEIDARLASYQQQTNDCVAGLRLFGFPPGEKFWELIHASIGNDAIRAASREGERRAELIVTPEQVEPAGKDGPEQAAKPPIPIVTDATSDAPAEVPTVRDLVVERLKEIGDAGSKAAPIREFVEKRLSTQVHDKTIGMTLWRLSKQGIVRRDGQVWFFVPAKAEMENPGATTPAESAP
jgi:hypothetical protein